jgi:hypothetical protein
VVAENLAGQLEGLVFVEPKASQSYGDQVWGRMNTVFSRIQTQISYPVDHQFDDIEDVMPVLYSNDRFGCQDYLPWKKGNQ